MTADPASRPDLDATQNAVSEEKPISMDQPWFWRWQLRCGLLEPNAHGYPDVQSRRWHYGHYGCTDAGDLGPCDCLCHRDSS